MADRRGLRALIALAVLLALAGAACTWSRISSDATVQLTGSVIDAAGSPVPGAKVALVKEADLGEVVGGLTVALSTLGLSCLVAHQPSFCARARRVTAGGAGAFSYTLSGSDTQGSIGNADTLDLTAVGPGGASSGGSTMAFTVQTTALALPALHLWGATPSLATRGGAQPSDTVSWPALPSSIDTGPSYRLRFTDGAAGGGGGVDWLLSPAQSGASVDARVLEDRSGTAEVEASTSRPGPHTSFRFTYRSATVQFHGPGAPPSRGAACLAQAGSGAPAPLHPCGLTDGNLFSTTPLSGACAGCSPAPATAAIVDLGTVRPLSLVVVRGATGGVALEGSNDLTTWTALGSLDATPAAATVSGSARYVRVRSLAGTSLGGLSEVSVW